MHIQPIPTRQPSDRRRSVRRPEVVKSAVRVLEILEFIDDSRAPVSVGQVAAALGFPQSSTSALLHSLLAAGYLRHGKRQRTYLPTERVPLLGNWVSSRVVAEGPLLRLASTIAHGSGFAAALVMRTGNDVTCVHALDPHEVGPTWLRTGARLPLASSAPGLVLLSQMPDTEVRKLIHRLNADADPSAIIRVTDLLDRLTEVRRRGFACASQNERAVAALPIPSRPGETPLVLLVAGSANALRLWLPAQLPELRTAVARGSLAAQTETMPALVA